VQHSSGKSGQLIEPDIVRVQLLDNMRTCDFTNTAVLGKMNVNPYSYRRFMNAARYKDS